MLAKMSRPDGKKLTLKIEGTRVTAKNFETAVKSFFSLVTEVGGGVSEDEGGMEWIVSVKEGSSLVEAVPEAKKGTSPERPEEALLAVVEGIEMLEEGLVERPEHFTDKTLRASQRLARVGTTEVDKISLLWNGTGLDLSPATIATVESLLKAKYTSIGSIEGTLKSISLRSGGSFNVYQPPNDHRVKCTFPKDKVPEVRDALDKRVSVWGEVKYRRDGTPVQVSMRELRVLGGDKDLPGIEDVLGILNSSANE